ncbi:MAG TPA: YdbH domain-containing protein [Vitreimonas sp.]|uniref:intermembrane phospholipid transport protein YdbH family protein n=1 Tax=Vitreimonas sp. TaxID=3069702 RepID=UPI002D3D5E43|nr:YdbH domain-containing protein [Vitreimonas sp.]HYD88965.1 YdbH domain-containing protein [Vitreimonas sp.]
MAHRSNQAVASQDQAPQTPAEPPRPRRYLIGWATALAALAVSTFLVILGLWLARLPLAHFMIGAALAERGAEADFQVASLDLNGLTLTDLRFGAETAPDAAIARLEARWRWRGLAPELEAVRITEPLLRLRLDRQGRLSAGALDRIGGPTPSRERLSIPPVLLQVVDGTLLLEAPFGTVNGAFRANGRIGENFTATALINETSRPGENYALDRGGAELVVVSNDDTIALRFSAQVAHLVWDGADVENARVLALARTPLDLGRIDGEIAWRIVALNAASVDATQLAGGLNGEAAMREDALEIAVWRANATADAQTLRLEDVSLQRPRFAAEAESTGAGARARWSLGGARFDGVGLISQQPAAAGRLFIDSEGAVSGDALVTMARTALDAEAQDSLRDALPDVDGAPIDPTFERARNALDAAADNFTLSAPIIIGEDSGGVRLSLVAPAEARAATGALLRLSPLRRDTPGLVLQWPGPRLHGAVALELSGGGAPTAALLLDTLSSSAEAPFEADGTLSLANWRAGSASIVAEELGVSISVLPDGAGRVDLRGPARITGPLGDGEVRDLVAALDLAISWGDGWRVTQERGCLPVALGGLDVAGLSFAGGRFSLCPLGGALIAADRYDNLTGGFSVRQLALNGRLAGPRGQPARVSAADVIGRFSGRSGDVTLAVAAQAPALTIAMDQDRTLALRMQRITANAHIADSWRVEGGFVAGTLADPTLPGSVSAIEGTWSAAPDEDDDLVVRIVAAEALLTANRPASEDERPLFNPLRLVNVDAVLSQGVVDANGAILLQAQERQLASFTAQHLMDPGTGTARIVAADLTFGPNLQPYDITERTRGFVENVTGSADIVGDIAWTRDAITSTGRVRLNGVSLATATIPIVENVNGEVFFDDLFALTTPPGQMLNVGLLNPGVAVTNGRVRFQLMSEQRVAIEQAEFDFASGILSMRPNTITLGSDETRFELALRDVDAASLLDTLNVPDLQATGRLEGSFPLILTRRSAFVEGGVVRAQGEGGTISYTGNAGQSATGVSRIAFEALRSFRYDTLSLTLDGDLNGDVVSSIEFTGRNAGRPVNLGPIIPGLGEVQVRGVPFEFNVRVTAPFRRLAQTAATITDPGALINQRRNDEDEEPVDPDAPGTE